MSKYHEKPDTSPRIIHSSIDGPNRYTIDFGERRRVKETMKSAGIRNKKKHKLRQKRFAIEKTKEYYGERYDAELDAHTKKSLNEMMNKNYIEVENEVN